MAQIETHHPGEAATSRPAGAYRGAFITIGNLPHVRAALGPAAAAEVLREVRASLGAFVEVPDQQVLHAGDDCFLAWLPESCEDALEDMLVHIGARPLQVSGHRIVPVAHAGWTEIRAEQPRELLGDEAGYTLFTAASGAAHASHAPACGERFLSDMEVASRISAAMGGDRMDCEWQGVSGLYGGSSFLYWRGIAQPEAAESGVPFAQRQAFMPSLERLNLTRALDRHMALRVLAQLIAMPSQRLACRISSLSVHNDAYWTHLLSLLAAHPNAARRFTLEISGRVPLPSREAARAFCAAVRELGAHIALASFGCGPINLADLQACQPRTLLLDESFALRCRNDPESKVALRDMVRICANLAEQVVVTGVNDDEAYSDAMRAGARWISGHCVNHAPPFAARLRRGRDGGPRSSAVPCLPRAAQPCISARGLPDGGGRVDWRGAGLGTPGRYVQ